MPHHASVHASLCRNQSYHSRHANHRVWWWVVVLASSALASCATTQQSASTQAARCSRDVPSTVSYRYPNATFLSLDGVTVGLYETRASRELINGLAAPLASFFNLPAIAGNVHVIYDFDYDALSTADGNVYVTLGALQHASSDQEITALIAHELGHLRCGHASSYSAAQSIKWGKLVGMLTSVTTGARLGMLGTVEIANDTAKYSKAGGSRENEIAADFMAVDASIASSNSYAGSIGYLTKITNSTPAPGAASALQGPDHPDADERRKRIREYVRTHYPDLDAPQPPATTLLDAWRRSDAAYIAALTRVESAAKLVSVPLTLLGMEHRSVTQETDRRAQAKLAEAYAQFAAGDPDAAQQLATLKALWLTRWVNAELAARAKRPLKQPITIETRELFSVLNDPQTPEWFVSYCGLIAAWTRNYVQATNIFEAAQTHFLDVTKIYPMHLAVLGRIQQEQGEFHNGAKLNLVMKCGMQLDASLTASCKQAMDNPVVFLDSLRRQFDDKLAQLH